MSSGDNYDDLRLIERILAGEQSAFGELVERHETYVRRIVGKHVSPAEVDDVAQLGFIEVYRSLKNFRGESSFRTWMGRIVLRQCYAFWRQRDRRKEVSTSFMSEEQEEWLARTMNGTSAAVYAEEEDLRLARQVLFFALERLNAEDRTIVTLVLLEDRSVQEVGEILGWSAVRVRVRVHRVREKLRGILEAIEKQGNDK